MVLVLDLGVLVVEVVSRLEISILGEVGEFRWPLSAVVARP
jgi:hypothetical protein